MRVKMLVTYEYQDGQTTVRHHKGTHVDVADVRGAAWVKQGIALADPVGNAQTDAQDPDKGLTKEERAEKQAALAAGKPWPPLKLVKDDSVASTTTAASTGTSAGTSADSTAASASGAAASSTSATASKRATSTTEG